MNERDEEKYEEYNVYRACGYEVESYQEWLGEIDAREKAFIRLFRKEERL
mgnify:CR=1 FL=1